MYTSRESSDQVNCTSGSPFHLGGGTLDADMHRLRAAHGHAATPKCLMKAVHHPRPGVGIVECDDELPFPSDEPNSETQTMELCEHDEEVVCRQLSFPLFSGRGDLRGFQDALDQLKYLALVVSLDLYPSLLTFTTTLPTTDVFNTPATSIRHRAFSSSYAGSPVASGSTSPVRGVSPSPMLCRKTVSFCEDQEFYEADDWDRSPAPVAPKLGYQDYDGVGEQWGIWVTSHCSPVHQSALNVCPPNGAGRPPPLPRKSSACSGRRATWPMEILELKQIMKSLPLAPQYRQYFTSTPQSSPVSSSSSSSMPFPVSRFASMPSATPSKWKNRDASRDVDREILPYLDSVPIQLLPLLPPSSETSNSSPQYSSQSELGHSSTPNTAGPIKPPISQPIPIPGSMVTPPPSLASSASASPRPSSPVSSSISSSLSITPSTPRHLMKFQIVPLLPIAEVAKPPPPPPVVAPSRPVKKFNMTFVPLLPPGEPVQPPTPTQATASEPVQLIPQCETPPEHKDEALHPEDAGFDHMHSPPEDYVPFNGFRSSTSTPSLSSASDTDTESETPSVSSPGPSSPFDDDTLPGYFTSSRALNSDVPNSDLLHSSTDASSDAHLTTSNHNPYFPPVPTSTEQTPRMHTAGYDLSEVLRNRKMQLQALPSPALLPPSPFSLYPGEDGEVGDDAGPHIRGTAKASSSRRAFAKRSSVLSQASDPSPGTSPIPTIEVLRNIPLRRVEVADDMLRIFDSRINFIVASTSTFVIITHYDHGFFFCSTSISFDRHNLQRRTCTDAKYGLDACLCGVSANSGHILGFPESPPQYFSYYYILLETGGGPGAIASPVEIGTIYSEDSRLLLVRQKRLFLASCINQPKLGFLGPNAVVNLGVLEGEWIILSSLELLGQVQSLACGDATTQRTYKKIKFPTGETVRYIDLTYPLVLRPISALCEYPSFPGWLFAVNPPGSAERTLHMTGTSTESRISNKFILRRSTTILDDSSYLTPWKNFMVLNRIITLDNLGGVNPLRMLPTPETKGI
ncbi:hypothetical protein BDY19DRAFT_908783 [Irpex rosettiformis]|uniref:Uncharacterized protein n=1 Tax=Irpex rosettiformis TaxID=378272 RepID=A0ACB8TUS0_9APHY|nr:hypothetical protein BDY19DRAFT_908783 [Irpex rosettiformis]